MAFMLRRGQTRRVWFLSGLSALFGLFLVFGAIFTGAPAWVAFASGGVATATVHGQSGDRRHVRYQVTFTTRDGNARTEWMDSTGGENLRAGDRVKIRYNRARPDDLYPASDFLNTWISTPLVLLVGGLIFLFVPVAWVRPSEQKQAP
jgi:uncharacterized membrane protein YedE/YeeE